jgi:hypothetical protein
MTITYYRNYAVCSYDDDYDDAGHSLHDQDCIEELTTTQLCGGDFGDGHEIERQAREEYKRLGCDDGVERIVPSEATLHNLKALAEQLEAAYFVDLPSNYGIDLRLDERFIECVSWGAVPRAYRWTINLGLGGLPSSVTWSEETGGDTHPDTWHWELWFDANSCVGDIVFGGQSSSLREAATEIAGIIRGAHGDPIKVKNWQEEGF